MLKTQNLTIGYSSKNQQKIILSELNLELERGKLVCLLGANGTGKSTLLRTLANVQPALKGSIELQEKSLKKYNAKQLAQQISVVLSDKSTVSNISVYELLQLGRSPYTNWLGFTSSEDKKAIEKALEITEIQNFAHQIIGRLSDGEYQRVMIARALVQDTNIIILDEPTAHLDVLSRIEILNLLHKLAKETQKTILVATHELELALQISDIIWLINKHKKTLEIGIPEELILQGTFEKAFQKEGFFFNKEQGYFSLIKKTEKTIGLQGNGVAFIWTKRALERKGYYVSNTENNHCQITVSAKKNYFCWEFSNGEKHQKYTSLEELLDEF